MFSGSSKEEASKTNHALLLQAVETLKSDPSKAVLYADSASIDAVKLDDMSYYAEAQTVMGEAYMNQGDFDMGFESLMNAVETCPADCLIIKAKIYLQLSSAYLKLKDFERSFEYVDEASVIYSDLNDSINIARCYNARGLIYIQIPNNEKAEENFKTALAINRRLNNIKSISVNLNNLCLYEGNTSEKIAMLYEAAAINDSLGNIWSLGENYNNLGTQYFYAKDYDKALKALDTAMRYSEQIKAKELIADNYRYRSWVYAAQNEYENSYKYLLELYNAEQELLSINDIRLKELNIIKKRLHDKEQQMILQKQSFQIRNLRLLILTVFLVVVALLIALSYIVYRSRNRKELEHNRRELTNLSFYINSRNNLLVQIQTKIKEGYKLSGVDLLNHLKSINSFLSQFSAINSETETLIDEINSRFIDKLSQRHPNLTRNEKRLAALLRIGLSSKEIASIINSTPKTVNMAQYRLRQRLQIESDQNLSDYMNKL